MPAFGFSAGFFIVYVPLKFQILPSSIDYRFYQVGVKINNCKSIIAKSLNLAIVCCNSTIIIPTFFFSVPNFSLREPRQV